MDREGRSLMPQIISAEDFEKESRAIMFPPFKSSFGAVRWRDLGAKKPNYDWLVKGLIAEREVTFLAGPSGSGKSFITTDLALAIARGKSWFGRKVKQGGVVYIAAESSQGVVNLRLPAYAKHNSVPYEADLPFLTLLKSPNFYRDEEGVNRLVEEILAFERSTDAKIKVVVVDTFAAATRGADEIKGVDMARIRERLQGIVDKVQATVICVHHMNKGGESLRGHSSLKGDYDSVLLVHEIEARKDANGRTIRRLSADKIKEGAKGSYLDFVLRSIPLGVDDEGDEISSCVVEAPERSGDETQSEDKAFVFKSESGRLLFGCLVEAMRADGKFAPPELNLPYGHRAVSVEKWRLSAAHKIPRPADPAEAVNHGSRVAKAVETAMVKFMNLRLIGHRDDLVWFTGRSVAGFHLTEQPVDTKDKAPIPETEAPSNDEEGPDALGF